MLKTFRHCAHQYITLQELVSSFYSGVKISINIFVELENPKILIMIEIIALAGRLSHWFSAVQQFFPADRKTMRITFAEF